MRQASDRIITVSNILSLFRLFLSIPLIWALEMDRIVAVLIMVFLAVLSDFFDGYLARRAHTITNVGKLLDPIADKFIMMAVMIFLIFDPQRQFPMFFFILLGMRDITVSNLASYLMNRKAVVFESNQTGKWFTSVTALAMILYILHFTLPGFGVLMIATILMLLSWYQYLRKYLNEFKDLPEIS
jgi:CDP-diacylglycerol--glycerol-3-phosphate 3-phosphatidyltransferase